LLEPVIDRYSDAVKKLSLRADTTYTSPDVYEYL